MNFGKPWREDRWLPVRGSKQPDHLPRRQLSCGYLGDEIVTQHGPSTYFTCAFEETFNDRYK